MIFSKPKFFHLSRFFLLKARQEIEMYLDLKGMIKDYYLEAYDYFMDHPTKYDGATMVKDLNDVYIDLTAMRHDYDYIVELPKHRGWEWLVEKVKIDFRYGKNIEMMGKGTWGAYSRVFGLWLSTPFYLIFKWLRLF